MEHCSVFPVLWGVLNHGFGLIQVPFEIHLMVSNQSEPKIAKSAAFARETPISQHYHIKTQATNPITIPTTIPAGTLVSNPALLDLFTAAGVPTAPVYGTSTTYSPSN
jgi:hypothetical protein